MKTDPISWFRKFELKLQLRHVSEEKKHSYLYSRSGGACQTWLNNLLSKYNMVTADLYTKISWNDLKAAWHKWFQAEQSKIKAMDKLLTFEQGALPSGDWIAEFRRLTSVPDVPMSFTAIKHYFITRSSLALGNAFTHVEKTLTTTMELFDKAAQIIVTNMEAKNLNRSPAADQSREQHRLKVVMVWRQHRLTLQARLHLPMKGTDSQPPGMVAAPTKSEDVARRRQTPHQTLGSAQQLKPYGPTMVSRNIRTSYVRDSVIFCGATTISTTQHPSRNLEPVDQVVWGVGAAAVPVPVVGTAGAGGIVVATVVPVLSVVPAEEREAKREERNLGGGDGRWATGWDPGGGRRGVMEDGRRVGVQVVGGGGSGSGPRNQDCRGRESEAEGSGSGGMMMGGGERGYGGNGFCDGSGSRWRVGRRESGSGLRDRDRRGKESEAGGSGSGGESQMGYEGDGFAKGGGVGIGIQAAGWWKRG
ncbi:hypothetical protein CBR_g39813 [Chara braunii]|uniref:Uncharacterized protein n=1 Tax=Chara braunii TaxID=69332 RepID=A0A388LSF5_CHABU|nr:hypothetical protein CBR_g39813 [Chara braunii]|eukprot:GBG85247.1 hypothetical protein CBR_g39813 [Chara braunii]